MKTNFIKLIILVFTFSIIGCDNEDYPEVEVNNKQEVITDTLEYLKERFNLDIRKATPEEAENAISMSYDEFIKLLELKDSLGNVRINTEIQTRQGYLGGGTYNFDVGARILRVSVNLNYGGPEVKVECKYNVIGNEILFNASFTPIQIKMNESLATDIKTKYTQKAGSLDMYNSFRINYSINVEGSIYTISNPSAKVDFKLSGGSLSGEVTVTYYF